MLDNDTMQKTLAADDGQDTIEAEGEDTLAAEEEIVIAIEGEEPEPDSDAEVEAELGEAGKRALKAARDAAKDNARKLREAEARLTEIEAASKPKEPELKRPTLEDCGFNEDVYAEKLTGFLAADEKRKTADALAKEAEKVENEAYETKRKVYFESRAKVGVDDDAEARVVSKLNGAQQTVLMDVCADPAKVVAALAKTPKVLEELAAIGKIHKFAHRLAQIEGKITVTTKTPPPPEARLRGGAAAPNSASSVPLEKLRAQADISGDWDIYFKEKRRRADVGVKS